MPSPPMQQCADPQFHNVGVTADSVAWQDKLALANAGCVQAPQTTQFECDASCQMNNMKSLMDGKCVKQTAPARLATRQVSAVQHSIHLARGQSAPSTTCHSARPTSSRLAPLRLAPRILHPCCSETLPPSGAPSTCPHPCQPADSITLPDPQPCNTTAGGQHVLLVLLHPSPKHLHLPFQKHSCHWPWGSISCYLQDHKLHASA